MRVYVPDKNKEAINDVLTDLYLLRQAIDYGSGNASTNLKLIDSIRAKLQNLLKDNG